MKNVTITIEEDQRQAILLAIAKLSLSRPGWEHYLRGISELLGGVQMYEEFKAHGPDGEVADQVREERDRLRAERLEMQNQSRTLTCAYCGHQYPPGTPPSNHEALTRHVARCPLHPMKELVDILKLVARRSEELDADSGRTLDEVIEQRVKTKLSQMGVDWRE
jgi:hypothetical protein